MSQESGAEEETDSALTTVLDLLPGSGSGACALQTMSGEFDAELYEFRINWQRELQSQGVNVTSVAVEAKKQQQENQFGNDVDEVGAADNVEITEPSLLDSNISTPENTEQQTIAENLFRKAVELEQCGKVYDALPLYRKAIQIVPDIEFKYYERQKLKTAAGATNMDGNKPQAVSQLNSSDDSSESDELVDDLYEKFRADLARDYDGHLILNSRDASVLSTELHISDLPTEILLYILRWVISDQLDMRSLEQCAGVCKGLYLCARDDDLWRLACMKVWGDYLGNIMPLNTPVDRAILGDCWPYYTWRQMFIERERVLFSGCYISKTTYLRMGENSFQDQFYRPVQLVEYYRYIRFMPDGSCYMMTNSDEPQQGVAKLRNLQQLRTDMLRGQYRLYGNTVSIILKKNTQQQRIQRQKRGRNTDMEEPNQTSYCIEFAIQSTSKRRFTQLVWLDYSIEQVRNKVQTTVEFDLTPSRYPPLWFSPVRSFHMNADAPLA